MNAWAVTGGVAAVALVAFGVAWVAGRETTPAPAPSSSSTAAGAVPPPASSSDVQAGFDFGSQLLRTAGDIYNRERDRQDERTAQAAKTREASGGSTPGATEH